MTESKQTNIVIIKQGLQSIISSLSSFPDCRQCHFHILQPIVSKAPPEPDKSIFTQEEFPFKEFSFSSRFHSFVGEHKVQVAPPFYFQLTEDKILKNSHFW